jgi:hypothetical protein
MITAKKRFKRKKLPIITIIGKYIAAKKPWQSI